MISSTVPVVLPNCSRSRSMARAVWFLAQSSKRSAVEVIATLLAIALKRAGIVPKKEIRMRGTGHQVRVQMAATEVSSNGSLQLVTITASLNQACKQLRIVSSDACSLKQP